MDDHKSRFALFLTTPLRSRAYGLTSPPNWPVGMCVILLVLVDPRKINTYAQGVLGLKLNVKAKEEFGEKPAWA